MMLRQTAMVATIMSLVAGCGGGHRLQPWEYSPRPMADTLPIWEPAERVVPLMYDAGHQFIIRPITGTEGGGDALNVDAMDGVVNSTWFTNRIGTERLSPEQVARGPKTGDGPDTSQPLRVTSIKSEGITPGFNIEDARGHRYIVKFDPPDHPELASGAEVIATSLFWAAGYNTPANHVFYFDPSTLVLDDDLDAMFPDEDGVMRTYEVGAEDAEDELTLEVLERNVLARYTRRPDGTVRALASRYLEGIPIGPFNFQSVRRDDPNDVIPHQHRRELRGLYVVDAWLNQTDAKQGNTLDMFIPAPGSPHGDREYGHIRHYLIDFGSALGSAAIRPHEPRHGSENEFDINAIGKRFLSLGFYQRPWQSIEDPVFPPSAGYYALPAFDPGDWRPNMANPAFDNVTPADGYWGAKIVMAFTDAHLRAAVENAEYSDPAATLYVLEGLKNRRDATGRYWFSQVSPLDAPRVEGGGLRFDDLYSRYFGGGTRYRYEIVGAEGGAVETARIPLPTGRGEGFVEVRVWKVFDGSGEAPRPATFWVFNDASGDWRVRAARY